MYDEFTKAMKILLQNGSGSLSIMNAITERHFKSKSLYLSVSLIITRGVVNVLIPCVFYSLFSPSFERLQLSSSNF